MEIQLKKQSGFFVFIFLCTVLLFFVPHSVHAIAAISKPPNNLGLVGYWSFNEATSTQATDFSGNKNHASFGGGAVDPAWVTGKRGGGLSFDNADDKITAPNSTTLDITSAISLAFWVKPGSVSGSRSFFAKSDGILSPQYFIGMSADELEFCITGDQCATTTSANLAANVWYHVTVTYSDSGNSVVFYVNGSAVADDAGTAETNSISSNSDSLTIGEVYDGTPANAALDEIRIYNRALGPTEAATLYNSTGGAIRVSNSSKTLTKNSTLANGLIGHWTFDGGDVRWTSETAGVAYDASGNNAIGTFTNMERGSAPVMGKLGQAMRLDGVNEYMSIASLNHNIGTGDFTWSAWVYSRAEVVYGAIMSVGAFSPNMTVRVNAVNQWGAYWGGDLASGNTLSQNAWHHLVMQREGTTLRFYEDGVVTPTSHTVGTSMANSDFKIGLSGGGHHCNCSIDDARFYNRALSVAEVKQLYNLGQLRIRQ